MWICTPQKKIMWVPTEDLIYKSDSDTVVGIYNFLPLLSSWCFVFVLFIAFSGECNLLDSISSQQKFEARDVKALGMSQFSDSLCYSSQTNAFCLRFGTELHGKRCRMRCIHFDDKVCNRASRILIRWLPAMMKVAFTIGARQWDSIVYSLQIHHFPQWQWHPCCR